jgi:hypothetical protein
MRFLHLRLSGESSDGPVGEEGEEGTGKEEELNEQGAKGRENE